MKLIDLLVKELPHRGGWPAGVDVVRQNCKGQLFEIDSDYCSDFKLEKCDDWITDVVTKQQYESALAASKAVVGHDGWIQWAGGDCPVDSDAIVEVKFRNPSSYQFNNDRAGDFYWPHDGFGGDIIAYRLQQPDINSRDSDDRLEQDLNECIGQDVDMTQWNGEGLPPVGCEYEVSVNGGRSWCTYRAISEKDGLRLIEIGNLTEEFQNNNWIFRPLRTEAERAREDAETAIRTCLAGSGAGITPLAAKVIYDAIAAGKIPGVKLEEE